MSSSETATFYLSAGRGVPDFSGGSGGEEGEEGVVVRRERREWW